MVNNQARKQRQRERAQHYREWNHANREILPLREAEDEVPEVAEKEAADEAPAPEVPKGQGVEGEGMAGEQGMDVKGTKRRDKRGEGISDTPLSQPLRFTGFESKDEVAENNKQAEDQPARKIIRPRRRKKQRTRNRPAAAADPLEEAELVENQFNQGVPGSEQHGPDQQGPLDQQDTIEQVQQDPMKEEVEDGQRQQDNADDILKDPRVIRLKQDLETQNEELRLEVENLKRDITDKDLRINHQTAAVATEEKFKKEAVTQFANSQWEVDKLHYELDEANAKKDEAIAAKDEAKAKLEEAGRRVGVTTSLMEAYKDKLEKSQEEYGKLAANFDEKVVLTKGLQTRIDTLEKEAASHQDIATENTTLQQKIQEVHTSFEDAFTDMAKGLTINEKFAYVREQQKPHIALGDSLDAELEHLSTAGSSEHHESPPPPKEILSFSGITTVETAPIAAPVAAAEHHEPPPPKEILSFSDITTIETAPIATPVAAAKPVSSRAPLALSSITTIETAPTATPAAAANPVSSRAPLALSGIAAVETAPTAGPKPTTTTTTTTMAEERPVHYKRYTPWWVWLVMSVALLACFGGFAALVRERQIWIDANSMAYQRLMGGHQETWVEWIGLGVESLISSIHGGPPVSLGHSYYG